MAAATITACQPQKVNLARPVEEQRRLVGALDDVVAGGEKRAAAEGKDHRIRVQRTQPAVAQPGNAQVQLRPGQLGGDDDTDEHANHAPQHGGERKPSHHRIRVHGGRRCGTDVLFDMDPLLRGNFTGCRGLFFVRLQRRLIGVNPPRSRIENARAFGLQVLELAAEQGPAEDAKDGQHQHGRQRDEQVQDIHCSKARISRGAQRVEHHRQRTQRHAQPGGPGRQPARRPPAGCR
jgi:hypothetical protein